MTILKWLVLALLYALASPRPTVTPTLDQKQQESNIGNKNSKSISANVGDICCVAGAECCVGVK